MFKIDFKTTRMLKTLQFRGESFLVSPFKIFPHQAWNREQNWYWLAVSINVLLYLSDLWNILLSLYFGFISPKQTEC